MDGGGGVVRCIRRQVGNTKKESSKNFKWGVNPIFGDFSSNQKMF